MKGLILSLALLTTSAMALENSYRIEFTNQKTGEVKIFRPMKSEFLIPMDFKNKETLCVFGESESKNIYNKKIYTGMLRCGGGKGGVSILLSSRNMPVQFLLQDGEIDREDLTNGLYFVSAIVE